MTDRLKALQDLRDKVAAGDECTHSFAKVFPVGTSRNNWLHDSYHGSLDAAKALHDALLPDYRARVDVGRRFRCWLISPQNAKVDAYSETPARAWLLAILSALIDKGDTA